MEDMPAEAQALTPFNSATSLQTGLSVKCTPVAVPLHEPDTVSGDPARLIDADDPRGTRLQTWVSVQSHRHSAEA